MSVLVSYSNYSALLTRLASEVWIMCACAYRGTQGRPILYYKKDISTHMQRPSWGWARTLICTLISHMTMAVAIRLTSAIRRRGGLECERPSLYSSLSSSRAATAALLPLAMSSAVWPPFCVASETRVSVSSGMRIFGWLFKILRAMSAHSSASGLHRGREAPL